MTKLEELLYSLTNIIVSYHDSQNGVTKIVPYDKDSIEQRRKLSVCVLNIIDNKEKDFNAHLKDLIEECTVKIGYPNRKPFLHFILNEITVLKSLIDKKEAVTIGELDQYEDQLKQLLTVFKTLLKTGKSTTCEVKYSQSHEPISLSGLKKDSYLSYGSPWCNSGDLLQKEVLEALDITVGKKDKADTTDEEIKIIAAQLCANYKKELRSSQLEAENAVLRKEVMELKQTLTTQEGTIKRQDDEISRLRQQLSDFRNGIISPRIPLGMAAAAIPASFFGLNRFAQSRSTTSIEKEPDFRFDGPE
ncbi:hypothetical protein [Legionella shakespearei]|uniref:Uncharacterized protein n=1 Tax=Legionella shakespearei DSM 23087 TaxID=1122169 RepID=A0A0W0YM40_9GAMM|nr:hypothetical protein [Legionella shakespearei]KTD57938.1 hypothetical protein Lsha_2216 [Legionella shakespearei DSM 23087]